MRSGIVTTMPLDRHNFFSITRIGADMLHAATSFLVHINKDDNAHPC
ncbi:MAG: hypothetical protein HOH37_06765 [Gammaproteobacteria bacterium]|nr:hypothetical protein [Gammaproteobacteria bacterium]